jgi:hypothetical protein
MHKRSDLSKWLPIRVFPPNGAFHHPSGVWTTLDFLSGEAVGDVALLYNLGASPLGTDARHVSITASSFGPSSPPLPTACSITVAQIISPPGLNNLSEPSLLSGLQKYFRAGLQLVKRGDVLVIPTEIDPLTTHITSALKDISHVSDGDL